MVSPASDRATVDRPSLMAPPDQLTLIGARLHEILITGGTFDAIYRHILAAPGKRVRAGLVLACARLLPSTAAVPMPDAVDLACVMEMFHEASLMHDDICDGSLSRRDAPSVPAAFGIRTAARAGFHLAGNALQVLARVLADNPVASRDSVRLLASPTSTSSRTSPSASSSRPCHPPSRTPHCAGITNS